MRALSVVVLLSTACSTDPDVGLKLTAILPQATHGVALHAGSALADAGMADQLCQVDVLTGEVVADLDPGTGQELLLDAWDDRVLAVADGALVEVHRDGTEHHRADLAPLAAAFYDGGVVAVVAHESECAVVNTQGAWAIPGTDCRTAPGFDVDRRNGTVWIADGDALTIVDPDGEFVRWDDVDADLVSFDAGLERAVVGATDAAWVQAMHADGESAWRVVVDGALHDVEIAGETHLVGASVERSNGAGFMLLEGASGERVAWHPVPEVASIEFSSDGEDLALVTGDQSAFYEVDPERMTFEMPRTADADGLKPWAGLAASAGVGGAVSGVGLGLALSIAVITD